MKNHAFEDRIDFSDEHEVDLFLTNWINRNNEKMTFTVGIPTDSVMVINTILLLIYLHSLKCVLHTFGYFQSTIDLFLYFGKFQSLDSKQKIILLSPKVYRFIESNYREFLHNQILHPRYQLD